MSAAPTLTTAQRTRLSKSLTQILRHKAVDHGLNITPDGYVTLSSLLALPGIRKQNATEAIVRQIVAECSKQRFGLKEQDGVLWIRANQGHSELVGNQLDDNEMLINITEEDVKQGRYPYCIHGTYTDAWSSIASNGLSRMSRRHIHFTSRAYGSQEIISGMRKTCDILIHVDMIKAMKEGIVFYISANGVILSEGDSAGCIHPSLFSHVERITRGRITGTIPRHEYDDEKKLISTSTSTSTSTLTRIPSSTGSIDVEDDTALSFIPSLEYIAVLDFEATCDDQTRLHPQEIIEFPIVLLHTHTLRIIDQFHTYIKPIHHPKLTSFCYQLTGIRQEQVDTGISMNECMIQVHEWLIKHQLITEDGTKICRWTWVTCGDWDLKTMLPSQLTTSHLPIPSYFQEWCNIKHAYHHAYKHPVRGMTEMLDELKIPLIGRHHSGIDDARNITSICKRMLADGFDIKPTKKTSSQSHTQHQQEHKQQLQNQQHKQQKRKPTTQSRSQSHPHDQQQQQQQQQRQQQRQHAPRRNVLQHDHMPAQMPASGGGWARPS